MMFHTWIFLPFFLIAYAVYLAVKRTKFKNLWILFASYVFYGWWNPLFLIIIAYSTVIDYIVVAIMEKCERRKKMLLAISIINNLALLSFFKYSGFVTENLNALLLKLGISYAIDMPDLFFPIGISFYIFKSIGYVIDYYRGDVEREKNFIRHATFVSFFPILMLGPIERAGSLLPQLRKTPKISKQDIADGFSLFTVGLFKKVALADYLVLYVDKIYDAPGEYQSPALILATFAFSWQIYFDFSGYTDMARGVARMMGFRLMLNFNNPYLATGLGDFWSRWHISLSSWFKNYVYIPLGGNRKGKFNTYKNMFLTMVISGLWHGAAWTFVIWGAVHALGRFCTRELETTSFYKERVPKVVKQLLVFVFVSFAWIFFRAETISDAWVIVARIFSSGLANPYCPLLTLVLVFAVWLYQFAYESRLKWLLELRAVRLSMIILMVLYLAVFAPSSEQPFIYLQF